MGQRRVNHKANPHLQGCKFVAPLRKLLVELRRHHAHPNRTLHYDDYSIYLLLAFYNPAVKSLRLLVELSESPRLHHQLGLHRTSLGSWSEASSTFDPELLRKAFLELSAQAVASDAPPRPDGFPPELKLLAADASLWRLLPRMARELYQGPLTRSRKGLRKGHFVFNVLDGVPEDVTFTNGAVDERHVLPQQLESGALYLLDRGYCSWKLAAQILDAGASLLMRLRQDIRYTLQQSCAVSETARQAGVVSDEIVRAGGLERDLRVVRIRREAPPPRNLHAKKKGGKHAAYAPGEPLEQEWTLLTDRLDLDAEVLAEMYAHRWNIEVFFRWLKVTLQCKHLFAESENGMDLQFYAALIATLLVVLHTGRQPTKYLWFVLHLYVIGWADWEQVERKIARCKLAAL